MVACFIGHRSIQQNEELIISLKESITELISKGVTTFLFGSMSQFNELAWNIVSELKITYPFIKRVYVRSSYPYINQFYENYLLKSYEETYFPKKIENAGKYSYVERNFEMINRSTFCVFYYNQNYIVSSIKKPKKDLGLLNNRNSGTKIAYNYALKNNKIIINLYK